MFPFGPEPTPEQKAEYERQRAEHLTRMQDNTHVIKQFINSLDKEGLRALDLILNNADSPASLSYWRGKIEATAEHKFEVCPCGIDHDAELADMMKNDKQPDEFDPIHRMLAGEEVDESELDQPEETADEVTDEIRNDLMEDYNLEYVDMHHGPGGQVLKCKGCGQDYPSLKDRMLKPPGVEGCSGCIQKTKFG